MSATPDDTAADEPYFYRAGRWYVRDESGAEIASYSTQREARLASEAYSEGLGNRDDHGWDDDPDCGDR